jgi:DNA-binding MarR family transcriptional regulator
MTVPIHTLGGLLRQLIDTLDRAVEQSYRDAGLDYRPRFTPIVRALRQEGPASVRTISRLTGISHSAISQTLREMAKRGLIEMQAGEDRREHIVSLSGAARAILAQLERHWEATERAARTLDADLGMSLPDILAQALNALEERSFADRIAQYQAENGK